MKEGNKKKVEIIRALDELGYEINEITPETYIGGSNYHLETGKLKILVTPVNTSEEEKE